MEDWMTMGCDDNQTDANCSDSQTANYTGTTVGLFAMAPLIRVVGSELERILFQLYLGICVSSAVVLNVLVLMSIGRERRLHNPENIIIGFDSVNNLLLTVTAPIYMLWFISQNSIKVEYYTCQLATFIGTASFLLTSHILALFCYERYYFLCNPINYPRRITKKRTIVALLVIMVISWIDTGLASMPDRVLIVAFMICTNRDPLMVTVANTFIYLCVSLAMTIFAVVKIKGLQNRSVGTTNTGTQNKVDKDKQRKRQVSAIKTILLVSGFYFMMYFPMSLMRLFIFSSGITPVDIEIRRFPAMTILLRWNTVAMVATTPSVNPILYLSTRKGLKNSFLQMLPFLRCRKFRVGHGNVSSIG